ncbi:hypothetical protein HFD88_002787 [Aspergillus terreus]|nr:hypothetical protein HFD88_002787 [Aspergillus terreus]
MNKEIALAVIVGTLLAITLPRAYNDYRTFLSYGPGGPPYNPLGWVASRLILQPFAKEVFSTTVYERKILAGETASFLSDDTVAARKRDRPVIGPHVAPHRQLTDWAGDDIKEKLIQRFNDLAARNPHLVKLKTSNLEMHGEAIFLADGLQNAAPVAAQVQGETAHIHRLKDSSLHVILSPADCKKLFEAGWAQRHGLSGTHIPGILTAGKPLSLPAEYVLIYAPRTNEEVDFVMEIVAASVKYMAGVEKIVE